MNYWWVNHKQTYRSEVGEGYIWSPFTNNDGSRNQSYVNLSLVQVNDIIFSYAVAQIRAVGVVINAAVSSERPASFGQVGNQWSPQGWLVEVDWIILDNRVTPKQHMNLLADLLPARYSPIQPNGNGNQKIYLAALPDALAEQVMSLVEQANVGTRAQLADLTEVQTEQSTLIDVVNTPAPPTTRTAIIQARTGQGPFRTAVESIEPCCRLTKVASKNYLIASHIKPWRVSTDTERLDGHNGLLLSPHVDKLFDKGYISFSNAGEILVAHQTVKEVMDRWSLNYSMNVGAFQRQQKIYMDYHRDEVFNKKQHLMNSR